MKQYRLGVTGSRHGINKIQYDNFVSFLTNRHWDTELQVTEFHHGDCVGADVQIAEMIKKRWPNIPIICHPPTNSKLRGFFESTVVMPARPYLNRDRDIVDQSDVIIAFPASYQNKGGTWYTINYAIKQNKTVRIFHHDGEMVTL